MNSIEDDYYFYRELLMLGLEIVDKECRDEYIEFMNKELDKAKRKMEIEISKREERILKKK